MFRTAILSMFLLSFSSFALGEEAWDRWLGFDSANTARIDHRAWDHWLRTWVKTDKDGLNRLEYGAVDATAKAALDRYIVAMTQEVITNYARPVQMAYWINLYNALTVKVILDHYPVNSIKDIRPGFFSFHPWDEKWTSVDGEKISLNDIEHRILRPIFQDNRVHYGVNCASIGCPNLQDQAFTAANLDVLLNKGARDYVNSGRGVSISEAGSLTVSKIYSWFSEDFGDSDASILAHIRQYAAPDLAEQLNGRHKIDHYAYDWGLNE